MAKEPDNDPAELCKAAAECGGGRSIYVLGVGFDPRCLVGLQAFLSLDQASDPLIIRVNLPELSGESYPVVRTLAEDNDKAFRDLTSGLEVQALEFPDVHDRVNAGPALARKLIDVLGGDKANHVIVDISSLPSSLYFPLIAALLTSADAGTNPFEGEFQVIACENPSIDAAIIELGVSQATGVGGFRRELDRDSEPSETTIWAPVVGESCGPALRAVGTFLSPDDVCPVLPFPAFHPRRADRLLLEHQREIFDEFRVAPTNVIYADESNPFDLYRTLCRFQSDYKKALDVLRPVTVVLSSHSSKLLSLGVLLAAYENELPVATAESDGYMIDESANLADLAASNQLACLWLTGAPYA